MSKEILIDESDDIEKCKTRVYTRVFSICILIVMLFTFVDFERGILLIITVFVTAFAIIVMGRR